MKHEFNTLKSYIYNECGKKTFYYLPNKGNWGDGLIRFGTLKLFNQMNLNFKELATYELNRKKPDLNLIFALLRGGILIYGGGGAWCNLWNNSKVAVEKLNRRFKIIVLPSTYENHYKIENVTFFCRDKFESKRNMPNAIFTHDMAFYIGTDFSQNETGEGRGYFFRTDQESSNCINIPANNFDISKKGYHLKDITPFFEIINKFEEIYTDRLHVSIAACLLGKIVHFFPGSYFKNRAVYMSSMKCYFKNIYFHDDYEI